MLWALRTGTHTGTICLSRVLHLHWLSRRDETRRCVKSPIFPTWTSPAISRWRWRTTQWCAMKRQFTSARWLRTWKLWMHGVNAALIRAHKAEQCFSSHSMLSTRRSRRRQWNPQKQKSRHRCPPSGVWSKIHIPKSKHLNSLKQQYFKTLKILVTPKTIFTGYTEETRQIKKPEEQNGTANVKELEQKYWELNEIKAYEEQQAEV